MFSLRSLVDYLRSQHELIDIHVSVDPHLEIAEIHRRVVEREGPALLFHQVKGSPFPVLTNLFGTRRRVDLLFPDLSSDLFEQIIHLLSSPPSFSSLWKHRSLFKRGISALGMRKRHLRPSPFLYQDAPNLSQLPMLTSWPEDGGPFLTLPLVYTQSPENGVPNLGMYRMQRFDKETLGLHFQIQKGGGAHFFEAEQKKQNLPVTVFLSGNPFLILSAIAPLPENVPELLFCSFLQNKKLSFVEKHPQSGHPLLCDSEFILTGEAVAGERRPEGPFGDHFGYYSLTHDFPIFKCNCLYHKKDAIYPATVVGKPFQEDFFLGNKLQELLSPLFPLIMPGVQDLKSYGEAGFHALAAAIVKERYWKEALRSALRILGEGQLSLTKFLWITDQSVDLENFSSLLECVLERMNFDRDLLILSETANDTLDYTGSGFNKGSKGIFLGVGAPIRSLPRRYRGPSLPGISQIGVFCRGCLVLETSLQQLDIPALLKDPHLADWPLVILVEDLSSALSSTKEFIWRIFTRSSPATDLHIPVSQITNHKVSYTPPMILNALMKPPYPKEVEADEATQNLVSSRWHSYFP
ncbi:menaquinone biosynthesis decarboxylase [Chlamydia trachomatis]|uniref:menaquinone biosynthesis decarboxylase n=1 Tax=Chlamydia trachomatis TaxID=813 RepID=UPI0002A7DE6D|nr:menaquinone biosynthesis decarboxylase [Chlamydia trachomatis]CCP62118.1 3-octaprenyl-4-hydroxybenzoate decarboxylase [Chlamydia trachomatis L1/440/LN]